MRRILLMLAAGAVMALMMAVSAGPASADDWDGKHGWDRWDHHGDFWDGCWKWSWVFERWKWDCDDDHFFVKDFDFFDDDDVIFIKDFDRRDHKDRDRHRDRDHKGKKDHHKGKKWWD